VEQFSPFKDKKFSKSHRTIGDMNFTSKIENPQSEILNRIAHPVAGCKHVVLDEPEITTHQKSTLINQQS
jgi:hypothetical protein